LAKIRGRGFFNAFSLNKGVKCGAVDYFAVNRIEISTTPPQLRNGAR